MKKMAHISFYAFMVAVTAIMFSCKENDIEQINKITKIDTSSILTAKNMKVDYTEKGKLVYTMSSPEMKKYNQPEEITEFPEGFNVIFFDSLQHQKGNARANYALRHELTGVLELRGDVIIENNEGKKIETEQMFWDRNKKLLYGNRAVRIITPDKMLSGVGFTASDDLMRANILHPNDGSLYFKDY